MDVEKYRYQKFISDIAGQDIKSHENDVKNLIRNIRNWLQSTSKRKTIPGGKAIHTRYSEFRKELPEICELLKLEENELTFNDYSNIVVT